ncbi:MAG TPA: hypothetical protein VKY85_14290 [Candidatus Angelobacter sp.]|nr:hypothetical protein [Candidatus Angelobacter sp.]
MSAQDARFVAVTPGKATILIGESQKFRVVDQNGRMQRSVSWTVSEDSAFDYRAGDELMLTAKLAGHFKITARTGGESAEAEINVIAGTSLPQGTAKWSAPQPAGCKLDKVVPATPSANGPDIFGLSTCPDGSYVSAYTAEGIQLWRHKVSVTAALPKPLAPGAVPAVTNSPSTSTHVNLNPSSICDLVSVGTAQEKVRDLLKSRNLSFSNESSNGQV